MRRALDGIAFKTYCRRLGFLKKTDDEAQDVLIKIRSAPPTRTPGSNWGNVAVWYPSKKMGFIVKAESHKVEFARVLQHGRDDGAARRVRLSLQNTDSSTECGHQTRSTGPHKVTGSILKTTTKISRAYKCLMLHWRRFIRLLSLLLASSLLTFVLRLKVSLLISSILPLPGTTSMSI